jgi:hypothetical protein
LSLPRQKAIAFLIFKISFMEEKMKNNDGAKDSTSKLRGAGETGRIAKHRGNGKAKGRLSVDEILEIFTLERNLRGDFEITGYLQEGAL